MAKLSRNRLRELNEANSALRGNVPSQKTIFNDFVDRNNDNNKDSIQVNENDTEPLKESTKEDTESSNMSSSSDDKDNNIEKDVELSGNKKETESSNKKATKEVSTKNKISGNENTSVSKKEPKKTNKEATKSTDFTKKEYNEEYVNMTVFLTTELNDYLEQKAFMTGTTIKKVFKEIMTNQMNLDPEEELVSYYRKSQRYEARRVVSVPSELKEDIKLAAMKYRMRMSSFVIYALAVAKRDDDDF